MIKITSLNSSLAIFGVVISLFLCDWTFAFLGLPSESPNSISGPINYEEVRENIEFQYVFRTNDRGLRYRTIPAEKPANTYRVFVSGDSFTEGVGVNDGERFTDLLEQRFQSSNTTVAFINGGLSGTGPSAYGNLFLEVGLEYNLDALLICLFVNDVANTPEKLTPQVNASPSSRSGLNKAAHTLWPRLYTQIRLVYRRREYYRKTETTDFIEIVSEQARRKNITQSQIDRWKESLPKELVSAINQGQFNGSILSYGLLYPEYWSDSIDISSTRARNKWRTMSSILAEILDRAKQEEIETAVVLIPTPFHYDPKQHSGTNPWIIAGNEIREEWLSEETEIQKKVRLWALSESVPFLDLTPVFREAIKSEKSLSWELDGHWNHRGHQVAANAIASWMEEQQVFSFMKNLAVAGASP